MNDNQSVDVGGPPAPVVNKEQKDILIYAKLKEQTKQQFQGEQDENNQ